MLWLVKDMKEQVKGTMGQVQDKMQQEPGMMEQVKGMKEPGAAYEGHHEPAVAPSHTSEPALRTGAHALTEHHHTPARQAQRKCPRLPPQRSTNLLETRLHSAFCSASGMRRGRIRLHLQRALQDISPWLCTPHTTSHCRRTSTLLLLQETGCCAGSRIFRWVR
jgi:hypothetical protein